MTALAEIGSIIEVTPWDDIWYKTSESPYEYLRDRTPFRFRVAGHLEDGQIFYGLFGEITEAPHRYGGSICSVMVRGDGSDWRATKRHQANFKVGPTKVRRNAFDFRHPEDTIIDGSLNEENHYKLTGWIIHRGSNCRRTYVI